MAGTTYTWIGTTSDPTQAANWSPSGTPLSGDTVVIPGGALLPPILADSTPSHATFDLTGNATLDFSNSTSLASNSAIDAFSVIDATGSATVLNLAGPFTNGGTIAVTGTGASLAIGLTAGGAAPGILVNQGTILVGAGNLLSINGGTIYDPGAILVAGGTASITGTLSGLLSAGIDTGGTLELNQAATLALANISFTGTTGLLKLDQPAAFVGNINNFALGDTIDLGPVNVTTLVFDTLGGVIAIGSGGTVFDATLGLVNQDGTIVLSGTGGAAGPLLVTEGGGGDTLLTILPPTTWQWAAGASAAGNTAGDWSVVSGPGNGFGYPQQGDTAINSGGTIFAGDATFQGNTLELGGTAGPAVLSLSGSNATSLASPTTDGTTLITSAVAGNATTETSVVDAFGRFINDGMIAADGPAGSSFTLAIGTASGSFLPGAFINYGEIHVAAQNAMTITVAGTSELLNAGVIQVDGGSLQITVAADALAGGYAPGTGVVVITGGGTVETNAGYAPGVSGVIPSYAFADATPGNTLRLDSLASLGGAILGFGQNDTIDLGSSLAVGSMVYNSGTGVLLLADAGGTVLGSLLLSSGNFLAAGTQVGTFAVAGTTAGPFILGTAADGHTTLTTNVGNFAASNSSGTWQSAGAWADGSVPGTLDTALIGLGAGSPFTLTTGSTPVAIGALALVSEPALLQITSNTTVGPYPLDQFSGTLEVTAGRTLTATALSFTGGTLLLDPAGVLDLTGHAVTGTTPNDDIVGASGGTISVSNTGTAAIEMGGGTLLVIGGTLNAGTVQASGTGGRIDIGYQGGGTPAIVLVENSGTRAGVVRDTDAVLASDPTSYGVLTLQGNARWTDQIDPQDTVTTRGYMIVGYDGQAGNTGSRTPVFSGAATLAVETGATLTEQSYAEIGATFDSAGSVLVAGGLWNIGTGSGGFLDVGLAGTGMLTVTNGGTVALGSSGTFLANGTSFTAGGINLGGSAGASGTLVVSRAGALVTDQAGMNIGQAGSGDLQVLNGGSVALTGAGGISIGTSAGAAGTVLVSGTDAGSGAGARLSIATRGISAGVSGSGTLDVEAGGTIQMSGTGGIAVGQSAGATGLVQANGTGALISLGGTAAGIGLGQGSGASGTLLVGGGASIRMNGTGGLGIGQAPGASGLVIVDGAGSLINMGTAGNGIGIGQGGAGTSGTLVVQNGGTILQQATGATDGIGVGQSAGATGLLVVTGARSLISLNTPNAGLAVGSGGSGTLQVLAGGSLAIAGFGLNVATAAGGSGTVTVSGAGSAITTSGSNGGAPGNGALSVTAGGSVSAAAGVSIGNGGTGLVTVSGGTLTDAGILSVGAGGSGTLTVLAGGLVQTTGTNSVTIGRSGGSGAVVINGGTLAATGGLFGVGSTSGAGTLLVTGGGSLVTGGSAAFSDINAAGAAAIATVSGGTWISNGSLIVGDTASGTLDVNGGGLLNAGTATIVLGNQSGGSGTLSVESGGQVLAGALAIDRAIGLDASGRLTMAGGTVTLGTLAVDANGTVAVTGGTLSAGDATIGQDGTGAALTMTGGAVTTGTLTVGADSASQGSIDVAGGTLTASGLVLVGGMGSGIVTVDSGGVLQAQNGLQLDIGIVPPGSSGTLVVNGGSVSAGGALTIGFGGTASLLVEGGGSFTATSSLAVAIGSALGGTAGVTNDDALFSTTGAPLVIGGGGSATMLVRNAGTVITSYAGSGPGVDIIGGATAAVTVTGTGSVWDFNASGAQFIVGDAGTGSGSLSITAGGLVDAGGNILDIGNQPGGNGSVLVQGGTLRAGTIAVGSNVGATGTLSLTGAGALLDANGGTIVVGAAGTGMLTVQAGGSVSGGALEIATQSGGSGTVTLQNGMLTVGMLMVGTVQTTGSVPAATSGTLTLGAGGVASAGSVSVGGLIAMAGGTLASTAALVDHTIYGGISGFGTIVAPDLDFQSITVDGGTLTFTGPTLAGTSTIDGGAALRVASADMTAATIRFATSGSAASLILTAPQAIDGVAIRNWQVGDSLVIDNGGTVTGTQWLGGTLAVFTSSGTYDFTNIGLAGGAAPSFTNTGNAVELVPCFAAGTRIATPHGLRPVESLAAGDAVCTMLDGRPRAIVWHGHRTIDCTRHPHPAQVWPVRIAAGAFGRLQPKRDLFLSPDHAVFVDGVLIPVKYLLNDTTITQVPRDTVTYHHLELSRHDVVLAEGLPTESYLDTGDRGNFANGGRAVVLHPDFASRVWDGAGCAELIVTGPLLAAVRARLARIATRRRPGRRRAA
jgi:T5SS/PEP-CTERM-associated repeat protein